MRQGLTELAQTWNCALSHAPVIVHSSESQREPEKPQQMSAMGQKLTSPSSFVMSA